MYFHGVIHTSYLVRKGKLVETSDIENEIKRRLALTKSRDEFDGVQRQLSCRISVVRHYQIGVLADKLNTTRTDLAEDLLEQATEIAWRAAGLGDLTGEDIEAIKALTRGAESRNQGFSPSGIEERAPSASTSTPPPPVSGGKTAQEDNVPPDRSSCFDAIFVHLGRERGKLKGTLGTSRDGVVRVCCLSSKDYASERDTGERYWFTIYDRHLDAVQHAQQGFVAFACGSVDQILLVPVNVFSTWCDDLPPYTQGLIGWHIHLTKVSRSWELRRKGKREEPIGMTPFLIGQ